ncbi:integrase [Streptomyces rochei]|uniref:integrase n=1 Tax=Streptomyces rochei TaxID=1928 RepID=UPI002ACDD047|nr:integrase [Streptomyces rochei]WQC16494.1 integrase [Streptomyces rochei]
MPYVEVRGNSIRVKWWSGEYRLDADGKPTKKKIYDSASGPEDGVPFRDEDEAYTYGLDRESDVRNRRNRRKSSDRVNMGDYCDTWLAETNLRPQSIETYRRRIKYVIKPYWSTWMVDEITPIECAAFERYVRGKYSDNYAKNVLGQFKMLMDDAVVKYRLRDESPIIQQRRRGKYQKKVTRRPKRALPITAVHQLAANAYTVWGYAGWAYIWTIAFTGMRPPGEMYGLQRGYSSVHWPQSEPDADVREEAVARYEHMRALRVQYQTYAVDRQAVLAGPKYDSHRTLVIPPFLHEMHAALLASHDQPWVFLSITGKPLLGTDFDDTYWQPIRDGADARPASPQTRRPARPAIPAVPEMAGEAIYRLRHWHKALLDEPGDIPRVAVEGRMGHELPGVEGVYSEVTVAMEERIVSYLQAVWEKQVVSEGLWMPPFPTALPSGEAAGAFPLFSGLPVLE